MKPAWKPIKVKLGQIKVWDKNPRMSTKAQAQRIIASERKFGQPVPFLISPDFLLYDGHQRLSAWFTVYGADYEMDAMQSDRPLSEDEHKELVITLHTGATGSWNWDTLSGWSAGDLQEWGMTKDVVKDWSNDIQNLKELLAAEVDPVDAEPQIDRAAELQEKWQTASGQLWKLGDHRLLIGDCTVRENVERLMGGEMADMVSADPPYGIGLDKEGQTIGLSKQYSSVIGDGDATVAKNIFNVFSKEGKQVWWGANHWGGGLLSDSPCWLVWDKDHHGMTFADAELAWTNFEKPVRCFRHAWSGADKDSEKGEKRHHINQKPVALFEWYFKDNTQENEIIVDPCCGVGGSLIAAHNLNRRCFAMEISEKYSAVILERFFTATGITPELVD